MDYEVLEILQARILEWVDFPFSRGSFQTRGPISRKIYKSESPEGHLMEVLRWSPITSTSIWIGINIRDVGTVSTSKHNLRISTSIDLTTPQMVSIVFPVGYHWSFIDFIYLSIFPIQIRSVAQSCPTLCDPMNRSMPGLPVHHQLPEFTQTHVHRVSDAI